MNSSQNGQATETIDADAERHNRRRWHESTGRCQQHVWLGQGSSFATPAVIAAEKGTERSTIPA
jgi:hypothetical protein